MIDLAVAAYWIFLCLPALALLVTIVVMVIERPKKEPVLNGILLVLTGFNLATLVAGNLNSKVLGPPFTGHRYLVVFGSLALSIVLTLLASRLQSKTRNFLFFSCGLLAAAWLFEAAIGAAI